MAENKELQNNEELNEVKDQQQETETKDQQKPAEEGSEPKKGFFSKVGDGVKSAGKVVLKVVKKTAPVAGGAVGAAALLYVLGRKGGNVSDVIEATPDMVKITDAAADAVSEVKDTVAETAADVVQQMSEN